MSQPTSSPPPFDPQNALDFPPPRRSSHLAWKIVLGLLGGGVVLASVCACGGYFAFRNAMSVDPGKVRSLSQEIATIKLPDYFKPMMSMSMMGVRMVMFDGEDGRGVFALIDVQDEIRQEREAFEAEMRQKIGQQVNNRNRFGDDEELEKRTQNFHIKGQPVELQVVTTANSDGAKFHEISGSFEGTENLAFIFVKAPDDQLTEDDLVQMIESIE